MAFWGVGLSESRSGDACVSGWDTVCDNMMRYLMPVFDAFQPSGLGTPHYITFEALVGSVSPFSHAVKIVPALVCLGETASRY